MSAGMEIYLQVMVGIVMACAVVALIVCVKFSVRLTGGQLWQLRMECWLRDGCCCVDCGVRTYWQARFDGDLEAYDMAHIQSRGAGGSDELGNVKTLCHSCHMAEHTKGRS